MVNGLQATKPLLLRPKQCMRCLTCYYRFTKAVARNSNLLKYIWNALFLRDRLPAASYLRSPPPGCQFPRRRQVRAHVRSAVRAPSMGLVLQPPAVAIETLWGQLSLLLPPEYLMDTVRSRSDAWLLCFSGRHGWRTSTSLTGTRARDSTFVLVRAPWSLLWSNRKQSALTATRRTLHKTWRDCWQPTSCRAMEIWLLKKGMIFHTNLGQEIDNTVYHANYINISLFHVLLVSL